MRKPVETLRKNINELIQLRDWNHADLARALNWPHQHLSLYMNDSEPGLDKIKEIGDVFGKSISEMLDDKGTPKLAFVKPTAEEALQILNEIVKDYRKLRVSKNRKGGHLSAAEPGLSDENNKDKT